MCDLQIFSLLLYGLSFHSLDDVLWNIKVFNFHKVQFIFFFFFSGFSSYLVKKCLPNGKLQKFSSIASSRSFIVLPFISLWYISSYFLHKEWGKGWGLLFAYGCINCLSTICWTDYTFLLNFLGTFSINQEDIDVWVFFFHFRLVERLWFWSRAKI